MTALEIIQYYNLTIGAVIILLIVDWIFAVDILTKKLDEFVENFSDIYQYITILSIMLEVVSLLCGVLYYFSKLDAALTLFLIFGGISLAGIGFMLVCLTVSYTGSSIRTYFIKNKYKD